MKPKYSSLEIAENYLKHNKIATLDELKEEIGTSSSMTVFRKLKNLKYLSSYSHKGKYYTLNSIPEFDETGLWSFNSIWFSKHGNLIDTIKEFIEQSKAGFSASELSQILNVEVKHPLLKLFQEKRIHREKISSSFIYSSLSSKKKKQQILLRKSNVSHVKSDFSSETNAFCDELKAVIILFYSLLNEKERRLYAGLESFKFGHGGDKKIAELLGLTSHTVSKGRKELLDGHIQPEGVRKEGGGRKPVEKKFQKLLTKLKKS